MSAGKENFLEPSFGRKIITRLSMRRSSRKSRLRSQDDESMVALTGLQTPAKQRKTNDDLSGSGIMHCNILGKDIENINSGVDCENSLTANKSKSSRKPSLKKSKSSSASLLASLGNAKEQAQSHIEHGITKIQGERYDKLAESPMQSDACDRKRKPRSAGKRPFFEMWNAVRRRVTILRNSHRVLEESSASPCRRYLDGSIVSHTGLDGELPVCRIETPYKLRSRLSDI